MDIKEIISQILTEETTSESGDQFKTWLMQKLSAIDPDLVSAIESPERLASAVPKLLEKKEDALEIGKKLKSLVEDNVFNFGNIKNQVIADTINKLIIEGQAEVHQKAEKIENVYKGPTTVQYKGREIEIPDPIPLDFIYGEIDRREKKERARKMSSMMLLIFILILAISLFLFEKEFLDFLSTENQIQSNDGLQNGSEITNTSSSLGDALASDGGNSVTDAGEQILDSTEPQSGSDVEDKSDKGWDFRGKYEKSKNYLKGVVFSSSGLPGIRSFTTSKYVKELENARTMCQLNPTEGYVNFHALIKTKRDNTNTLGLPVISEITNLVKSNFSNLVK